MPFQENFYTKIFVHKTKEKLLDNSLNKILNKPQFKTTLQTSSFIVDFQQCPVKFLFKYFTMRVVVIGLKHQKEKATFKNDFGMEYTPSIHRTNAQRVYCICKQANDNKSAIYIF